MGLYERILSLEDPKIAVHQFMAALAEYERGNMTAGEIVTAFELDATAQAEAVTLESKIIVPSETVSIGGFTTLTNIGASYDAISASQGLGWFRIEVNGISQADFRVKVNKIGGGTQSWQLWNETNSAEVAVIDDAGAAGAKELSVAVNFIPALTAGIKTLRVRAKSTTAADDPLYFGATVGFRRVARLTSVEVHEVLLLAETALKYGDVTSLKTRLGV